MHKRRKVVAKKQEEEEQEEQDRDEDFVLKFKQQILQSRVKQDLYLPSLETDWRIQLDFEKDLAQVDIENRKEVDSFQSKNPTFRKSREVCTKWLHGLCIFADFQCPQLHIYDPKLFPICRFFIKDKSCTNPDCIFRHPGREEEVICVEYARGFCKDGPKCDFSHRLYAEEDRSRIRHLVDEALQSHRNHKRTSELQLYDRPFEERRKPFKNEPHR